MPKFNVEKSITIDSPAEKVYQVLSDFNQWRQWSPWLITEPEAKVTVTEEGKAYAWEGNRTGSGNMRILDETANRFLNIELNFLKPWKSTSKVRFRVESEGESTKVTWMMDGGLPFFMFWMKKMMVAFIGMDYERGLNMLKEFVEKGEVSSKLDFKGVSDFSGYKYVGIKRSCTIAEIGDRMMEDFGKLKEFLDNNKESEPGLAFSIYHKWDMVKGQVDYTAGWAVKNVPGSLSDGLLSGEIPETKVYTLSHTGPYSYLGNAWSALYAMHRAKEFKPKKGIHPFEVYINDPADTAEKDLVTDINFAVAG